MRKFSEEKSQKRENSRTVRNINHSFFNDIGEIQAYLLGFYLGDGSLYKSGNSHKITVTISIQDIYIVQLFRNNISPNSVLRIKTPKSFTSVDGKIYQGIDQVIFSITSNPIGSYFESLGFGVNKTKKIKSIPNFTDENKIHFLRGYFDADGCIMAKIRKEGWMNRRFQLTSFDRNILDEYVLFLERKGIKAKVYSERNHFHLLVQKKNDIIKLYDLLYSNATFFLKRKQEKFIEVKKTPSDFRKLKSSESCNA